MNKLSKINYRSYTDVQTISWNSWARRKGLRDSGQNDSHLVSNTLISILKHTCSQITLIKMQIIIQEKSQTFQGKIFMHV